MPPSLWTLISLTCKRMTDVGYERRFSGQRPRGKWPAQMVFIERPKFQLTRLAACPLKRDRNANAKYTWRSSPSVLPETCCSTLIASRTVLRNATRHFCSASLRQTLPCRKSNWRPAFLELEFECAGGLPCQLEQRESGQGGPGATVRYVSHGLLPTMDADSLLATWAATVAQRRVCI